MPLLIDGHNLIGQIPDISLSDPDDEAKLVLLLRRYTTARPGRQAVRDLQQMIPFQTFAHEGKTNWDSPEFIRQRE